ncbi:THUMP domain-containing class I SAM-dependent RNA methyltransferase [Clostridium saccharobutylicum]|uniref:Putative RNA methyltransferase YpsC n=1 Tax=Clostridium saccharobutylicum DSM 13864 TaxID=1345695 RepID=U5MT27_CLOSA|nr:class I SAM-dependent RNA methyltransferase [Clostridium saccharobutylicum]AGX43688.1 putative RNA methyltransferase YpsC [Clostridium saccharobutylicum DSM 13864]AQR90986.1 ribosomal RNA large subunit methyltransferase L [Clostridium saccharobutylicum]AQS00890.1 ribosomal RNA large subunit methyltransferase L [Clostridium saccharobutylicum]AQS10628.1 ribosomal RNA large subunit methyltransferase L [Clostridium saccharobutylicum]AQS14873.1 ribosomal RNA large subunit methyltransferase L [Cl
MMYDLIATSTFGIESITAKELKALGYEDLKIENGKVSFEGDEMDIAIANVHLRTADRVLIKMAEFEARSFEELFQGTKKVDWSKIIPVDGVMHVVGKSVKSTLHSVPDCQSIVKKAIVNSMSESYGIEQFSESGPVYKIEVAILKDVVTLTIDTTGPGLHKRGYRELAGIAPLKETLAASMLLISRWKDEFELIDPFCGSGTILIEAAMIAQNIAPGVNRSFVSESWPSMSGNVFNIVKEGARKSQKQKDLKIIGYDIDYRTLKVAMENAEKAGVDKYIQFQKRDFMEFSTSRKYGFIVSNPPYGERIGEKKILDELYKHMGRVKKKLDTWDFNILTSFEPFEKTFGIKSTKNRKLYNGKIKCYYYQYFDNDKIKNFGNTLIQELIG